MRILVIDDYVESELAIAYVLRDTDHVVAGARDPVQLPNVIADEEPFDLALVDMIFADCPQTGLGALRALRELSPDTECVVRCADDEENRLLHLLAAFSFFTPLALMPRSENPAAIKPLLDALQRGEAVASSADQYRHYGPPPAPLDMLLRNETDLRIWQELTWFDKRPDIARASFVSSSAVDHFIGAMYPVVEGLQTRFRDAFPVSTTGAAQEHAHNTPLIRLAHFARVHQGFFRDPDLVALLEGRWGNKTKTLSAASAGVRKARRLGGRRGGDRG
ncbi:MAG: hypothetical protein ACRDOA_03015 [Streptosporangiaceae bacterium]